MEQPRKHKSEIPSLPHATRERFDEGVQERANAHLEDDPEGLQHEEDGRMRGMRGWELAYTSRGMQDA